jgi:hypothetical protein
MALGGARHRNLQALRHCFLAAAGDATKAVGGGVEIACAGRGIILDHERN